LRVGGKWTCIKATNRKGRDVNTTFSEDEIERAIRRLSMIDIGDSPDVWFGMRFMEHFGVDLSLNYRMIRQYLTGKDPEWWEFDPTFTPERTRALLLILRDVHRSELNFLPLTKHEICNWQFENKKWKSYLFNEEGNTCSSNSENLFIPNCDQIQTVIDILKKDYPSVVNYIEGFDSFYEENCKTDGWYQNYRYRNYHSGEIFRLLPDESWLHPVLDRCFQIIFGASGQVNIYQAAKTLQKYCGRRLA
jgi:hypothetical protein